MEVSSMAPSFFFQRVDAMTDLVKEAAPVDSQSTNAAHLDKLRADSILSPKEQTEIYAKQAAQEAVVYGPGSALAGSVGMSGVIAGIGITEAAMIANKNIEGQQYGREVDLIKRDFKDKLGKDTIEEVEANCRPGLGTKATTYAFKMGNELIFSGISGMALSPVTGGWSVPGYLGVGAAAGYRNSQINLYLLEKRCQAESYRHVISKW